MTIPTLIVGWRTRKAHNEADTQSLAPAFKAPSNYKDDAKIAEYVMTKKMEWAAGCKDYPYTGTFDCVHMVDVANRRPVTFHYKDRQPGGTKAPICLATRNWLLKKWGDAWPDEISPVGYVPKVIILGFEPRAFLKMLGIECSLPQHAQPLPLSLWYGEAAARNIRNIVEAVLPSEYQSSLDLATVFKARGIKPKDGWDGPGVDPEEDVRLVAEMAAQLGMIKIEQ
jgi:hypothetical protein